MTAKELAARLSGRKIMQELSEAESAEAASAGLVVVYGYSDDTIVFEGAITDDRGCFDGGTVFLTQNGLMPDCCPVDHTDCSYYKAARKGARSIKAVWGDAPCWRYETDIPHEEFDIFDDEDGNDGEVWCRGIVFRLEDVK